MEMSRGGKVAISIITVVVLILGILGTAGCAWWIYLKANPDLKPTTADITYVGQVLDTGSGEQRYFIEIDYWRNDDGAGKEVFELAFTGYTDYKLTASKARGVQFVNLGDNHLSDLKNWAKSNYDRYGYISWKPLAEDTLDWGDYMFIDLKGVPYGIAMAGQYSTYEPYYDALKGAKSFFTGKWNVYDRSLWYSDNEIIHDYTMLDFYQSVANALTVTSEADGEYVLPLVEMSTFFTIARIDDNGTMTPLNKTTFQDEYFAVKCRVHSTGMVKASQSAFKTFLDDNDWTVTGLNDDFIDYSNVTALQTLSAEDFEYLFASDISAYVPRLKSTVKTRLITANVSKIDIKIDFNDLFFTDKSNQNLFFTADYLFDDQDPIDIQFDIGTISIQYKKSDGYVPLYFDSNIFEKYLCAEADLRLANTGSAPIQKIIFGFEG